MNRLSNRLLIRTDGDRRIGTGHVMRCLAIAQAWQQTIGGTAHFLCSGLPDRLSERLRSESIEVHDLAAHAAGCNDADETIALAGHLHASWTVVDGYQFDANYQSAIAERVDRLLVVDDFGHYGRYTAAGVLNPNASADPAWYRDRAPNTRLLLGAAFTLLRADFAAACRTAPVIPDRARRVVVTYGGADRHDDTLATLRCLADLAPADTELVAVVGAAYEPYLQLRNAIRRMNRPWHVERNVTHMADRLAWADLAISAAGSTTWELCALGIPSVLVVTADNQRVGAVYVRDQGLAALIGEAGPWSVRQVADAALALAGDPAARRAMAERMRSCVDGRGATRVVRAMAAFPRRNSEHGRFESARPRQRPAPVTTGPAGPPLRAKEYAMQEESTLPTVIELARLTAEHLELVRQWRNDPQIAQFAANREAISAEQQSQWFRSIDNNDNFYFMISVGGEKTGVVNLKQVDWTRRTAESGIYIVHSRHRNGFVAKLVLIALLDFAFDELELERLLAHILRDNERSARFHHRLGYELMPGQESSDNPVYQVTRTSFHRATDELRESLARASGMIVSLGRGRPHDRSAA